MPAFYEELFFQIRKFCLGFQNWEYLIILFTELFFNNNTLGRPAAEAPIFVLVYRLLNILFFIDAFFIIIYY